MVARTRRSRTVTQEEPAAKRSKQELSNGDPVPAVTLKNQSEVDVDLSEIKGFLVLFAYPKASTPGCTKQTKGFGELAEEFTKLGATVYGVSADTERAQTTFKNKLDLAFDLLSDPQYELLGPLGARKNPNGKGVIRSHWVFKDGKLVFSELGVSPGTSPQATLDAVKRASGEPSPEAGTEDSEKDAAEEPQQESDKPAEEPKKEETENPPETIKNPIDSPADDSAENVEKQPTETSEPTEDPSKGPFKETEVPTETPTGKPTEESPENPTAETSKETSRETEERTEEPSRETSQEPADNSSTKEPVEKVSE